MSKPATTTSASLAPSPVSAVKQTASTSVTTPPTPPVVNGGAVAQLRLPSTATVEHAMKLAINEDRPIMMDYWKDSIEKTVLIGQRDDETKEKILVRSEEEYTSPIKQILKVGSDYIIMTENSIYLVDTGIPFRRISA